MSKIEFPEVIKVKCIQKAGYFGLNSYPRAKVTFGLEINKGGYKTGLTDAEQEYFENILELKKGELGRHSKFWDKFTIENPITLDKNKTNEFVLDNPIAQLKYKIMLASSKVANSELERNPNALFYIDDEESKAKTELETFNYEFEGMKLIIGLTPEEKRGTLRLFDKKGLDSMSESMMNSELSKELKKDPKRFMEVVSDSNLKTKMFIAELLEKRILTKKNNNFINGDDIIAISTDECVEYLDNIKNQSVRLMLETKLKKAKKG